MERKAVTGRLALRVETWFRANGRPLPWRVTPRDPYLSLVSEFMLQQTQVARVLERFGPFVAAFPGIAALARAPERRVLALWSGLGYYRRAKHLHAAARAIVRDHGGTLPVEAAALRELPGIGRYSAGALSSIVFGKREALVDGNVVRVLLRVHGRDGAADEPGTVSWVWDRAATLVNGSADPGALNEGLMELGATVCTARSPRCGACPLARDCVARREGTVERIPRPKREPKRSEIFCASVLARDDRGRMALQQRPGEGMWASMWQAPTLEQTRIAPTRRQVQAWAGVGVLVLAERFEHQTSHRALRFDVWRAIEPATGAGASCWVWRSAAQIARLGLSNPQRRILLGADLGAPA